MPDQIHELVDTICNDLVYATENPCEARQQLLELIGELALVLANVDDEIASATSLLDVQETA